jgi:hypothetical protein
MSLSVEALAAVDAVFSVASKTVTCDRDSSIVEGEYNIVTGEFPDATAFTPVSASAYADDYKRYEIDNVNVKVGDQKLYMKVVSGYTPQAGDTVTSSTTVYRVMSVQAIEAEEGVIVLYILQLRV